VARSAVGRRFEGRVVIVTGASTDPGIGTATARRLAREGARVVINARQAPRLEATARMLTDEGLVVVAVAGAAGDDGVPGRLVDAALDRFGRLDHLVNAVGGAPFVGSALSMGRDEFLTTVTLNTWPTVALIQEAVERGLGAGGSIVNISSGSPAKTTPVMAAYAAAKSALNALTRTLANDLGPRGIRVNAVSPGLTRSETTRPMWESDDGAAAGANLLLGRITEPDDIAAATAFLLSDEAASITGVLLDVDAGNHVSTGSWSPFSPGAIGAQGGAPSGGTA